MVSKLTNPSVSPRVATPPSGALDSPARAPASELKATKRISGTLSGFKSAFIGGGKRAYRSVKNAVTHAPVTPEGTTPPRGSLSARLAKSGIRVEKGTPDGAMTASLATVAEPDVQRSRTRPNPPLNRAMREGFAHVAQRAAAEEFVPSPVLQAVKELREPTTMPLQQAQTVRTSAQAAMHKDLDDLMTLIDSVGSPTRPSPILGQEDLASLVADLHQSFDPSNSSV